MEGHIIYGEYISLNKAVKAWEDAIETYVNVRGLSLKAGRIGYSDTLKTYQLTMRFDK